MGVCAEPLLYVDVGVNDVAAVDEVVGYLGFVSSAPPSTPGNSSLPGMSPSRYRLHIAITPYPLWVWRWSLYRAGLA